VFRNQSLTFLLQRIFHLPERFGEDQLGGLGDTASCEQKRKKKFLKLKN